MSAASAVNDRRDENSEAHTIFTSTDSRHRCSDVEQAHKKGPIGKRKNQRIHAKRAKRRALKAINEGAGLHAPRVDVIEKVVKGAEPVQTDMDPKTLPANSSGFAAKTKKRKIEGTYVGDVERLIKEGYTLVKWDGKTPKPLVSDSGQIFAVLAGQVANDPSWLDSCNNVFDAIKEEGIAAGFTASGEEHCRGNFPAVNVGITMGYGATYPTNLSTGSHTAMMERLLANRDVKRISNFVDSAFNIWAPNLYKRYMDTLNPLFHKLPYLRRIIKGCIFPTAAFNFGGNVVTKAHRDCMNYAVGWCAVVALGTFDPSKGGHIVFPDLKIVVEFPPASVILIPSATLTHANTPVMNGERASFTLYCSGGLFRYVVNGFRTESQLAKDDPVEYARPVINSVTT
ncbi:hypothetical protein H0H93_005200 [Arthromyces matolae]|nr:hypothetical protein H0H93_005200 [Arthromyces matolae]